MAKYLKKKCLLEAGVKVQTCLHFEALYVSWIFPEDRYYLQKAGQDCELSECLAAMCQKIGHL